MSNMVAYHTGSYIAVCYYPGYVITGPVISKFYCDCRLIFLLQLLETSSIRLTVSLAR